LVARRGHGDQFVSFLADLLSTVFERRYRQSSSRGSVTRPLEELAIELIGSTGETSGLVLAQDILSGFEEIDDAGKLAFFKHIATEMNIDPEAVRRALDAYEKRPSKQSYRSFMVESEPGRQELIHRLNRVQGATGCLVRMRADLLRLARETPELAALDLDFKHLLISWFNRGFLVLRPINWESPAHILEKSLPTRRCMRSIAGKICAAGLSRNIGGALRFSTQPCRMSR
jgi:malonyl-CoA decarboxylase